MLEADTAIGAALEWSEFTFASAETVLIGRDDVFADNLASGVLQGTDAPLLLTDTDELDAAVADEIERLGATDAIVLGGEEAISPEVEGALEDLGLDVSRLEGETRIETAIAVAEAAAPDADSAILARAFGSSTDESQAFADSLAAGAWAAESGMPVLLTQTNELNDNLAAYLDGDGSSIETITIVGGTAAVGAAVVSELEAMGIEVDRVSGATRFETAVEIAEARGFADAGDADEVILVEGQQANAWAGGFAAAAYSAINGAPIVLANGEDIPAPTQEFLEGGAATASLQSHGSAHLVCGPLLESEACDAAAEILGLDEAAHTNEDFTVGPDESAVNTVSDNAAQTTQNRGQRQYTVSGLDNSKQYDIALIPSEEVATDSEGVVTFRDNNVGLPNNADNLGGTTGLIEVVNGASTAGNDDYVNNVTPQNGTITFTVDSITDESVVPVVFQDADNDNNLDLVVPATANTNPKEPSEDFGIGGRKTWTPAEAAAGQLGTDRTVTSVDKDLNYIVAGGARYNYDENDTFQIATANAAVGADGTPTVCTSTTMANFEQQLSRADELDLSSNYTREVGAASVFCLEDVSPGAPTLTGTAPQDADTIRLTWTQPATGAPDRYNIYRLQTTAACPEGQTNLSQYTKVADVAGTVTTYDDNGLAANTRYCYIVTAVQDGDESAPSASGNGTTAEAGTTVQPQSTDVYIDTDTSFPGVVSEGDIWRVVFDKQMQPVDAGDTIVVRDAQGDVLNVVCNGANNADCAFNTTNVTVAGASHGPGRVLTVTIMGDRDGTAGETVAPTTQATGGNTTMEYPLTITTQNGFVDTAATPNPWTPADDPDNVVDNEGSKTFVTATDPNTTSSNGGGAAPEMISWGGLTATTVDVNYDEAVVPYGAAYAPAQFCYDQNSDADCADAADGVATAVTQVDSDTLRLTFAAGKLPATAAEDTDQILYIDNQPAFQDSGDVVDTVGTPQPNGDEVDLESTAPAVAGDAGSVAGQTFTLDFSEPINQQSLTCSDVSITDADADAAPGPTCNSVTWTDADTAVIGVTGEAIEAGDTLTLAANSVTDMNGNTGPAAPYTTGAAA